MEDTISAMESATAITKKQGMSHPHTIPTCPPVHHLIIDTCVRDSARQTDPPEASGKENVEVTEAITPMIDTANAIVSNIYGPC